jgi:hypothetical protein
MRSMPPMLKTIDVFIGLALIMLLVSMIVTVITQAVTNVLNSRGKHLWQGVTDMLQQLDPAITRDIAGEIADAALRNPLVSGANGRLGNVIHREELIKLLLELGAGDGPKQLSETARSALQTALVNGGICSQQDAAGIPQQIRSKLANVRSRALQLELTHPQLTNAARARVALIQQADSQFLAKVHLWFDQTMDRASERFTAHTRYVTFFAGLAVALALQLDTAALVSRLSVDDSLRNSLVDIAKTQPAPGQPNPSDNAVILTPLDRQSLKDLVVNNVFGIPQSVSDWTKRWTADNWSMKLLGIVLSAFLLSLGAPFWYSALQNLIRLRSVLATKDDQQREERQVSGSPTAGPPGNAPDGVALTDERGDLAAVA